MSMQVIRISRDTLYTRFVIGAEYGGLYETQIQLKVLKKNEKYQLK